MAYRIGTNVTSTFSTRKMGETLGNARRSEERLSSGSRINHGADDAAGLSVSEKNRAAVRGLAQAGRNIEDAFSFISTADGAFQEINGNLTRIRELAVQAASDTVSNAERGMIEVEVSQLKDEIERVAVSTEYSGKRLLDGSAGRMDIQVDTAADTSSSRISLETSSFDVRPVTLGIDQISVTTKKSAQQSLDVLTAAVDRVSMARSSVGSLQNRLESSRQNMSIYRSSLTSAGSRVRDTDMAEESADLMRNTIVSSANASITLQANQNPSQALKLMG